jgi:hypothetical protein
LRCNSPGSKTPGRCLGRARMHVRWYQRLHMHMYLLLYICITHFIYIYMDGYISCNLCLFELKWRIVASLLPSMDVHLQSYWQGWVLWPKSEWIQELASDFGDLGLSSFRDMWVCPKIGYIPKFDVWGESLVTLFGSPILQLFAPLKIQSLLCPAKK